MCENPKAFPTSAPVSKPLTMGLTSETNRIVQEFDYGDADLNKSVLEFLSQMGMLWPHLSYPIARCASLTACRYWPGEGRHQHEPDPHIRHRRAKWYREGKNVHVRAHPARNENHH